MTDHRRRRRAAATLATAALLIGGVAGCSSPTPVDGAPTPSASASPSLPAGPEPAAGELVSVEDIVTFHLTEDADWRASFNGSDTVIIETNTIPEGAEMYVRINASRFPQISDNLARMGETARDSQSNNFEVPLTISENRVIDGVTGYVLEGTSDEHYVYEWGGLDSDNVLTVLTFAIPTGLEPTEWIEPILATVDYQ